MALRVQAVRHEGRPTHEARDCTVRALASVAEIPYPEAHQIIRETSGRRDRHRCLLDMWSIKRAISTKGRFNVIPFLGPITVAQFALLYPRGRYYIQIRGHAFALVDGCVLDLDLRNCARARIRSVWHFQPF